MTLPQNIDEDAKVISGTAGRADPARDERLARMNEAVQALLLKYDKAAAPAAASTSAQDGDGAA